MGAGKLAFRDTKYDVYGQYPVFPLTQRHMHKKKLGLLMKMWENVKMNTLIPSILKFIWLKFYSFLFIIHILYFMCYI